MNIYDQLELGANYWNVQHRGIGPHCCPYCAQNVGMFGDYLLYQQIKAAEKIQEQRNEAKKNEFKRLWPS